MNKKITLLRCWLWAAMHSPNFESCQLRLERSPMIIKVSTAGFIGYNSHLLIIRVEIPQPRIFFNIPFQVFDAFVKAMKIKGEDISYDALQDVPF